MRVCLKNMKYLYFNKSINEFGYYEGNCYIENGMVTGFGNEETGFDAVYDLTNRLVMPMMTNLNCNVEDIIYRKLEANWDSTKFASLENTMGTILANHNKDYYEEIAPAAVREIVAGGTGLIGTRRCYKTLSNTPIFAMTSYPIGRSIYLRNYINQTSIDTMISANQSPNLVHGFNVRNLYDNDDGSLSLVRQNLHKVKYIATTIGLSELSSNLVKQKWIKDELQILNTYDLLHKNTLLLGCNVLSEKDVKRIKDVEATIVYAPTMAQTLKVTPPDIMMAENLQVLWCLSSGSPSCNDSLSMFNILKQCANIYPSVKKELLFKAATINPVEALNKILGIDISGQANFTIVDAPVNFTDVNSVMEYIFNANPSDLHPLLMMGGNFVTYNEPDKMEDNKNVLRSYYKRFDTFLINPNMFVTEVPQKP
ncbi:MAG: hypothetical protein MJ245_00065 [Clostridia bacterium]|nr:hypothetical protein [Clostridia bacterium]